MPFQFKDLVLFLENTGDGDKTRLRLQDVDERTKPIELARFEMACPGRTSGGLISLDSLEDLKKALAELAVQLKEATRGAKGKRKPRRDLC